MNPIDKITVDATNIICEEIDRAVIFDTIKKAGTKWRLHSAKIATTNRKIWKNGAITT
jgi:hypothetical protein